MAFINLISLLPPPKHTKALYLAIYSRHLGLLTGATLQSHAAAASAFAAASVHAVGAGLKDFSVEKHSVCQPWCTIHHQFGQEYITLRPDAAGMEFASSPRLLVLPVAPLPCFSPDTMNRRRRFCRCRRRLRWHR